MDSMTVQERRLAAGSLGFLGLTLSACAAAATAVAVEHMARDAGQCGPLNGHCGWCYGAAGLVIGAVATIALAIRLGRTRNRAAKAAA